MWEQEITDDLDLLVSVLPPKLAASLKKMNRGQDLLEVVLDLGRLPEARFTDQEVVLDDSEVTEEEIEYVVPRIGDFGEDNRAGIERTLHRISASAIGRGRSWGSPAVWAERSTAPST